MTDRWGRGLKLEIGGTVTSKTCSRVGMPMSLWVYSLTCFSKKLVLAWREMVVIQGKGLLILLVHNACWNNVPYGLDYHTTV